MMTGSTSLYALIRERADSTDKLLLYLESAEQVATGLLAVSGAVLDDDHWMALAAIAKAHAGDQITQDEARLLELDRISEGLRATDKSAPFASDVAVSRYGPEIAAAYYLGLAIGYRLGGRE